MFLQKAQKLLFFLVSQMTQNRGETRENDRENSSSSFLFKRKKEV